ncbi:hypothetical protein [Nodularia spumigena]|uniref:hypothetical protein n=1 Tax=Nodularia spumigena TaxID=70799 RepID=UPI0012908344
MTNSALPETIQTILDKNTEPDSIFSAILPAIGEALQCDRCFLYFPHSAPSTVTHQEKSAKVVHKN